MACDEHGSVAGNSLRYVFLKGFMPLRRDRIYLRLLLCFTKDISTGILAPSIFHVKAML